MAETLGLTLEHYNSLMALTGLILGCKLSFSALYYLKD